jgi:hypothetical protein
MPQPVQLYRDRVRRERRRADPDLGQIVEFLVEDQVGNVADDAVCRQILRGVDRRGAGQIVAAGGQMQP